MPSCLLEIVRKGESLMMQFSQGGTRLIQNSGEDLVQDLL